jgi:8-oxo-dGTP pyrophosphatase MutT (NUDIX family)
MEDLPMHQEITQKLEEWIDRAKEILPDFSERKIAIQTIPWIISRDILNTMGQGENNSIGQYIFLRKNSSKDIVFPSWSIDGHELHKGQVNPQWLLLAAMREFKEELYGLLSIDMDSFIDVYPHLVFENNGKKYMQFRLLAKVSPYAVSNLDKQFAEEYQKDQKIPEHDACYVASYDQAMKYVEQWDRTIKESTWLSLEHHMIATKFGAYWHKI